MPNTVIVGGSISLIPSNKAAFEKFANDVSNPRSPSYHRFITPAEVGVRYGASVDTVNKVTTHLKSAGLTVILVADNRMTILFKGKADKVEKAFSTQLFRYKTAKRTDGGPLQFFANNSVPKMPTALAGKVLHIGGLQNAYGPVRGSTLTPAEIRSVYNVTNLYANKGRKGTGINIGITNYDGYRLSNLPIFYSRFGLPGSANVTKVAVAGDGETYNAQGEADLDLQCTFGSAPSSHVYMYDSKSLDDGTYTFADSVAVLAREANDNIVDIVTESYGFNLEFGDNSFFESMHLQHVQMTAQGITYLACSGDTGTDWLGYPDIDPDVLVVGGSIVTTDGFGGRISETGWDGSGSGYRDTVLSFNVKPPYQTGDTVPTNVNRRLFPDLALHATGANALDPRDPRAPRTGDPDFVPGYFLVFGGQLTGASGTSASSPALAGQLALILEDLAANGIADVAPNGRPRLGRINDLIYGLNGDPTVFTDLLGGDAGVLLNGGQAVGKEGWDYVTGWGAPIIDGLRDAVASQGVTVIEAAATDVDVFSQTAPRLVLGTDEQGTATSLVTTDGESYSLQSVRQAGLGQVAGATIDVNLKFPTRRSASVKVTMSTPELTTGYVYLFNYTTNKYDLLKTVTGSDSTNTANIPLTLDEGGNNPYILNPSSTSANVKMLVRAIQPSRFGASPFRLVIDQAVVIERIPRTPTTP